MNRATLQPELPQSMRAASGNRRACKATARVVNHRNAGLRNVPMRAALPPTPPSQPTLAFRLDNYASAQRQAPHRHDELHLSLVLRGTLSETVGRETAQGAPLSVVVKAPDLVHANAWGNEGARLARLSLPQATLAALSEHPGRDTPWRWYHDVQVARPFLRLVQRHQQLGTRTMTAGDTDLNDLVAALTARPDREKTGEAPRWLRDVVQHLHESWHPSLDGHQLAAEARVHSVYLARCIRRWYGVSLGSLLRHERLRYTAAMLTASRLRGALVAQHCGFADEAHMSREVKALLGLSPRALRAVVDSKHGAAPLV